MPIRIRSLTVGVYRAAIAREVITSFGTMRDRPALFLRLEDAQGCFGFGEVWCNFPACGAEHRARLLIEDLAPLLFAQEADSPGEIFDSLAQRVHVRALQTGEAGPYAQTLAGLDMAVWDLHARAQGSSVRALLAGEARASVPAYASGIHIRDAEAEIGRARERGCRAFKVKVGFDMEDDCRRLHECAASLGAQERLFCDANQAWRRAEALDFCRRTRGLAIGWLEEPLAADAPLTEWQELARQCEIALAAGENMAGEGAFGAAIASRHLAYLQPDIAKWGGFTGCWRVARAAQAAGLTYCPHFLGGGIGLIASANLLAAAGGDGLLEVDANPNPLRDAFL
ncbi:MAG: mandelate racemase/muconate lactonizing enzyme family protein, partial [Alphaproteobacteria bacterium]